MASLNTILKELQTLYKITNFQQQDRKLGDTLIFKLLKIYVLFAAIGKDCLGQFVQGIYDNVNLE